MKNLLKKPSTLLLFVGMVMLVVIANRFYQFYLERNFLLLVNTACNPAVDSCFVQQCEEGEPECDTVPYKKVEILAALAPVCLEEHTCEQFYCDDGKECLITYCSNEVTDGGESCIIKEDSTDSVEVIPSTNI